MGTPPANARDRGPTYTEAHRHACEVRWVIALPTREHRLAYIEGHIEPDGRKVRGIRQIRGDRAADRLRDDVRQAWRTRSTTPPAPAGEEQGHDRALRSVREVNEGTPVDGSFLGPAHAGDSDPVRGVVSGVSAR